MAPARTKRRSIRQAATRQRSIYVAPDTDDEDDFAFEAEGEEDFRPDPEPISAPPPKRRKTAPRTSHITRSKSERRTARPSSGVVGRKRRGNEMPVEAPKKIFSGPSDGRIPEWTSLPVEILRDIFIFASKSLSEQTRAPAENVNWVMKAARTCRAFAVPALEAYYLSPSTLTQMWPHYLLELMRKPKEKSYMDYNVKVKELSIDVRRLAYAAHQRGLFNLSTLVAQLPQLQHLEVLHPVDEPPFRPMKVAPWHYPPTLFQTLSEHSQRLRSFRWRRDMIKCDATELYAFMAQIHSSKSFEYLRKLTVCGFDYNDSSEPPPPEEGSEVAVAPGLATSITLLPSLKDLTFISCDVIMDKFLERLPRGLERLELTNCLEITSEMLKGYLAAGGAHLKELVLKHNTSLNLDFLPVLKLFCPQLQVLRMDLRYYSERLNSNDAEPLYDELLAADAVPAWPSSLRQLEIEHMQKFSAEAAVNLFRSLVDSAKDLPELRHLVLAAHINIPWRDRAGFRDQWIGRLRRVYQRLDEPPASYLGSLRQFKLWKQAKAAGRGTPPPQARSADQPDNSEDDLSKERKLSHIQISPAKPHDGDTDVYSDSPSPPSNRRPQRRSTRVAKTSQPRRSPTPAASATQTPASPSSDDSDADANTNWRKQPEAFIQGLCRKVDIRIDNQRPRENQFTEGDFLDAEASGDEDWHEGADMEMEDEDRYAW